MSDRQIKVRITGDARRRKLERENASLVNRLLDHGERINHLTDEISRLRAAMPADVLREYDRGQRER